MNGRVPILVAAGGNCLVAALTCAVEGWTAAGLHAAARNTARFSSLWFVVAFAAPRLRRLVRSLASEVVLIHSFVAAHLVHFGAVALLLAVFERTHVSDHPARAAMVVIGGFSLVLVAGLMATPRLSRFYPVLHSLILYVIFAIFFLAFLRTPVKALHPISVLLGIALILRLTSGFLHADPAPER